MPESRFERDRTLFDKLKAFNKYFKPPNDLKTNALQTWVVVAHYKWTVGILSALFTCILCSWFITTPMECVLKFNKEEEIPDYQKDLCLSYPFTYEIPRDSPRTTAQRKRIYALHYRWVHWAILFLIPLYSIPIFCRKYLENSLVFNFIEELNSVKIKDRNRIPSINILVENYLLFSGWIYKNALLLHFVTLLVDIVAFAFIDIALQNRFARLFPLDYPFERWPQYFNDTISIAFPPFVECKIGPEMLMILDMEETLGCQLNLMILYDKVFVLLWVWMVLLTSWTIFTIFYFLLIGVSKRLKKSLIYVDRCKKEIHTCLHFLTVDDLLVLNCLRNILTANEYKNVLKKISEILTNLAVVPRRAKPNFNS